MMKKALVLSLVLVFALASTAMATVNFTGSYEAGIKQDAEELKVGWGQFEFYDELKLNLSVESEDAVNWEFSADLGNLVAEEALVFGEYKLSVYDKYFDVDVWGRGKEHTSVSDAVGLMEAAATFDGDGKMRATIHSLDLPVIDEIELVVDVEPSYMDDDDEEVIGKWVAFTEVSILDYMVGVGIQRDFDGRNTGLLHGAVDLDFAKVDVSAGMTLGEDDPFAFGAKTEIPVMDELTLDAGFEIRQAGYANDDDTQKLNFGATYTEDMFQVKGSYEGEGTTETGFFGDKTTLAASAAYRMSDTVGFGDLFGDYNLLDALAVKLGAELVTEKDAVDETTTTLRLDAAAPLMPDMAWGKADVQYIMNNQDSYEIGTYNDDAITALAGTALKANAELYVTPIERLTLKPSVGYTMFGGGAADDDVADEGSILTVKNVTEYEVGSALLSFEIGQNTYDIESGVGDTVANNQFATLSVKVEF